MRTQFRITLCLAALLLGGCEMPTLSGITCLPIEPGDCGTPVPVPGPAAYLIGFPRARLEKAIALGKVMVFTGSLGAVWSSCGMVEGAFTCTPMDGIDVVP